MLTGRVPDGMKTGLANYSKLEVDICGVHLARIPHGLGWYLLLYINRQCFIHMHHIHVYYRDS